MTDRGLRGAELARRFFADVVEPLLSRGAPGLGYAAGRLGSGSDVLGLDDAMSRDHDWGCRLTLLVDEDRLVSVGLAGDVVWLAFALSRRWAPYAKWRGTAFRSLPAAAALGPLLGSAAAAPGWREREDALAAACEVLLDIQRGHGHPAPALAVVPFFERPYRTVDRAVPVRLLAAVTDPDVARLPPMVGSVEQWADSVDVLSNPGRRAALRAAYRRWDVPGEGPVSEA